MNTKDFIYYPRLGGYRFTPLTCAFGVEAHQNEHGVWVRYHQCDVKGSYEIDGFKFCGSHKKIIEKRKNGQG